MIIGLTGKKGSGKDTVGAYLVEKYGFTRIGFADKLKESAAACFGIDPEIWDELKNDSTAEVIVLRKDYPRGPTGITGPSPFPDSYYNQYIASISARQFLQNYGTEAHREVFYDDFWIGAALNGLNPKKNYVITDVRFDNEAKAIIDTWFNSKLIIKVSRNNVERGDVHASEQEISESLVDGVLSNNGTIENLHHLVDAIMIARSSELHG